MLYFLYTANRFRKSALDELRSFAKFRIIDEHINMIIIDSKEKHLLQKFAERRPVLIYSASALQKKARIIKGKYLQSLLSVLMKLNLPRSKTLKIECFDINSKESYSAKDIEVYLGQKLEEKGYRPDLADPDIFAYLVLLNGICYAGSVNYHGLPRKFINPFRHYGRYSISRSELKLRQAFDEFGIKEGKGRVAIDLGAAPGGWSMVLAEKGYKVIAIDSGELDYAPFEKIGINVKAMSAPGRKRINAGKELNNCDILHIKAGAESALRKLYVRDVALIADDMNIPHADSAELLEKYSRFMLRDGVAIMTLKCINRNIGRHMAQTESILRRRFNNLQTAALPSNRQEATVFASIQIN